MTRTFSKTDVTEISNIFFAMGLSVLTLIDLELDELNNEIKRLSRYDFTEYDSIHIICMSHGKEKNILHCKDGEFNFIDACVDIFQNPTLKGKPKYVVVEACKGEINVNLSHDGHKSTVECINKTLTALVTSSFEGHVSFSNPKCSSFVRIFVNVLQEHCKKEYSEPMPYIDVLRTIGDTFEEMYPDQQKVTFKQFVNKDNFSFCSYRIKKSKTTKRDVQFQI